MPGVDVASPSVDFQEGRSFRSHKTLSRRGAAILNQNTEVAQTAFSESNGSLSTAPAPPLTPPRANQEKAVEADRTPRHVDSSLSEGQTAGTLTPRGPSKPPTPDFTPPRTTIKRPTMNQFVYLSSSSRAESFHTACEGFSTEGEMETPARSSHNLWKTRQRTPSSRRNVSNGPGGNLIYAQDSPNTGSLPYSETEYETGFESFDGEWASAVADSPPTPPPGQRRFSQNCELGTGNGNEALDAQRLSASLMREKSSRDGVYGTRDVTTGPSKERLHGAIGGSSYDGLWQADDPDSHRLSGISSTSTVEAMIIDSPKRAQRLLRHTEKRSSLRSASSPITRSERTSLASNPDSQHRLVHKAARISEQDRRSISSDLSRAAGATTATPHTSIDIIPVVVIPERRSSLKSGPTSQVSSKPASQRSSHHPPVSSNRFSDDPRQKRRTMSDSMSASSRDKDSRGRSFGQPVIPTRSSSLSAPASRNPSRATSLTSESLRSHTLAMDLEMQKRLAQQPVSPPRHNILGIKRSPDLLEPPIMPPLLASSSDDMTTLRPPSLPYTQWSVPSSSPGPIEIQEAKAVSLFPHHNTSLLLVHQCVQPALLPPMASGEFQDYPQTSDLPTRMPTIHVESPLQNPRPPPQPPQLKPVSLLPTHENVADAELANSGPIPRRWNSVGRPWGARPRSDTFSSIARSLSMKSAKNRKAGVDMDSRLHPFWRPRGFWEDVPSSPEKDRSERRSPEKLDDSLVVNNSLGLPQQRIIFDGPPSLASHRSPEMRRVFNASHASLVDGNLLRTGSPLYQHRYQVLSRWSLRFRSMSLRNVRNRLRRIRQRRDERKRLARQQALKQSIEGPVFVVSSATNGVVR